MVMTGKVEKWLQALPEEAIQTELENLRNEALDLQRRIEVREQALTMKRALSEEASPEPDLESLFPVRPTSNGGEVKRGRDAIRTIIAALPHRTEWSIPDMLAAMHERGWPANTHSVQVNLSRMYRDGELTKHGTGIYVPAKKEVPAEADTS